MGLTTCPDCNSTVSTSAQSCPKCGRPADHLLQLKKNLSRTTAGLLALLLGGLGVHRFYLGRPGSGVLYLLFCWTFVPAFLGFLEAIVLLSMSDSRFEEKYCA